MLKKAALAAVILLAGCDSILGPEEERVVGIVDGLAEGAPQIEIPETVQAGEDFTVTVTTWWPNGCARQDATEVQQSERAVTVTPYDVVKRETVCTAEIRFLAHTATLRLSEPGTATVIVRGRPSDEDEAAEVEFEVEVEP